MRQSEAGEVNVALLNHLERFALELAAQHGEGAVRRVACDCARELCSADAVALRVIDRGAADTATGDASREPRLAKGNASAAGRCQSTITVPLLANDVVIGVLEAVRGETSACFERRELDLLARFALHVAAALEHAQIEADLTRAQTTLRGINDDLEARVQERTEVISRGKREWESTFDAIADPVVVLDGHTVRRANGRYKVVSGDRPWTELVGRRCHEVFAGRSSPCENCPLLTTGLASTVRIGESLYHANAYRMAGENAWVVHYRDITEQRQLAERLRQAEQIAAVGQLASGVAHEINNPLSFIISNLSTLREVMSEVLQPAAIAAATHTARALADGTVGKPEAQLQARARSSVGDALEIVGDSLIGAGRITEVVKSLRELKSQEMGRPEPVDVNQSVRRALTRVMGDASGVQLSLAATGKVRVAAAQLDLAIEHVLRNARQATTRSDAVTVATSDEPAATVLKIVDRGCGIPAEHLRHVFEPFFTTRQVGSGRGLGLTVTWGVVKQHGGDITIQSEVGVGTTVTMTFPHEPRAPATEVRVGRYAERPSGLYQVPDTSD